MIIIQLAGGLGNQMQQYAMYQKLLSLGKKAKLDISWFEETDRQKNVYVRRDLELNYFKNVEYEACTEEERKALAGSGGLAGKIKGKLFPGTRKIFRESEMYHPEIFDFEDKYLYGYFACEKYYADIMETLWKQFVFPESGNPENRKMAERIRDGESVSVHIRRGDYLDAENAALFGNICTEEYYAGAIREMKQIYPSAHFFVFSDDVPYAKKTYIGEEFSVVDINRGKDSFYDMWLMSRCRHNICANSTFSFWGARLNQYERKIVMRPTIHRNNQVFEPERMHELWKRWVFVDNRGNIC